MRKFTWLIAPLLVVGCMQEEMLQKFSTPEDQKIAAAYIEQLRSHEFDLIQQATDPSLQSPGLRGTLQQMAASFPNEREQSVKLVGAQRFETPGAVTVNTTFEYQFRDRWIVANVATRAESGKKTIVGLNIYPESQSLEETNRFTLGGRGLAQYAVFGSAIAAALISVYALIVCVRTKTSGRKWPWIVFILFGFGKLAVNWTTGQVSGGLLQAQLLSAGALAPLYGPWTVAVSLPIGALLFLAYGHKRLAAHTPTASITGSAPPRK